MIKNIFVSLLIIFQLSGCTIARNPAQDGRVESYLERPQIQEIKSQVHDSGDGLVKSWEKIKRAQLEYVAQLIELYPDHDLYFLARDSEMIYDFAKLNADEKLMKRIHLLNVSRPNVKSPHIKEYLLQQGISEKTLQDGKKVIFVDTGYKGSIPLAISQLFPAEYRPQIQTHLICSNNSAHPSSRVFLWALNPHSASMIPGDLHGTIIAYEDLPRYTQRSHDYLKIKDQWVPVSYIDGGDEDSHVSKKLSEYYQQDLAHYSEQSETKNLFLQRRLFWREIKKMVDQQDQENLINYMKQSMEGSFREAAVRDLVNFLNTNNMLAKDLVSTESFGFKEITTTGLSKFEVMKKYPQFRPYLEKTKEGIDLLFKENDIATLGQIIDVLDDEKFYVELSKKMGREESKMSQRIINLLIDKSLRTEDSDIIGELMEHTFSQKIALQWKNELAKALEVGSKLGDWEVASDMAEYVLSRPHARGLADVALRALQVGTELHQEQVIEDFEEFVIDKEHTKTGDWSLVQEAVKIRQDQSRTKFFKQKSCQDLLLSFLKA